MRLTNIQIQNYKRIRDIKLELNDLTRVNYLVGENGCGKSSVLNYIHDMNPGKCLAIKDSLGAFEELELLSLFKTGGEGVEWKNIYEHLVQNGICVLDLLGYSSAYDNTAKDWGIVDQESLYAAFEILEKTQALDVQTNILNREAMEIDQELLTGGDNKIINLTYAIVEAYKNRQVDVFTIEEPAVHLHPKWQKRLVRVFEYMTVKMDIQLFVSTHSPFIISSAGEITECEEESSRSHTPNQKVYFLKDGRVAGKKGTFSSKGRTGYWGRKVSHISSGMLGAGLMDLFSPQEATMRVDAPVLVFCEGEGEVEDAKIYNTIFEHHTPRVLFVSSRGSSQLYKTFELMQEIKPGLSADFRILMLRDRDHEFGTEGEILEYEATNPKRRVLRRRALEAYLFNLETAKMLFNHFGVRMSAKQKKTLEDLDEKIQASAENKLQGDGYKAELYEAWKDVVGRYIGEFKRGKNMTVQDKIAHLITHKSQVYKELDKIIFQHEE